MAGYEPDVRKIHPNPFGFKTDPKEADAALGYYLRLMAKFFECVSPRQGQVEAAWQSYQGAHDGPEVLRLAFSVSHVLGIQGVLESINGCEQDHDPSRFSGFQVLLHLGLIELVESGPHVSQYQWANQRLKENPSPTMPVSFPWYAPWRRTVRVKDVRRMIHDLGEAHAADKGTRSSLVRALTEGLSEDDRATLLNGWSLSEPYGLGKPLDVSTLNHLHCRRRYDTYRARLRTATSDPEKAHIQAMLSPKPCTRYCKRANSIEVAELFPVLVKDHLYHMRNELVHAASPMQVAHSPNKAVLKWMQEDGLDVPMRMEGSILDGYFIEGGRLVTYEATVKVETVTTILRRCLWNRLGARTP